MNPLRTSIACLLGLLACLLLPFGVLSVWVAQQVSDTAAYVDTVGPLAEDPTVKDETVTRVADEIGRKVPEAKRERATLEQVVDRVVDGPEFPGVWRTANRVAHQEIVKILADDSQADRVTIDLKPVAKEAAAGLRKEGLPVRADQVPSVPFTVARGEDLRQAQGGYAIAKDAGFWSPIAWVLLVALTLLAARRRLRALAWLAAGSAVMTAAALLGLRLARSELLSQVPSGDRDLATAIWEVTTRDLRTAYLTIAVIGLVVTLLVAVLTRVLPMRRNSSVATT
jgi:hypothetical protein